jgi:hypothetical protein
MILFVSVLSILIVYLYLSLPVHAILFFTPAILLPVAKIIALVWGAFSLPALSVGVIWRKLFRKHKKRVYFVIFAVMIGIGVLLAVVLKIANPSRPWF